MYRFIFGGIKYEKTPVGFLCSDAQNEIESEEQCKHAAESLGLQWGNSWNGPNDFPACLHAEDGRDKVYYNLSPGLPTNLNPKYSAVCKAKGTTKLSPPYNTININNYNNFNIIGL